jgi:hypothetical protein
MKVIIRPVLEPSREIDLTRRLVEVIAEELWKLYGGNEGVNWLEAEQHLEHIVGSVRAEARVEARASDALGTLERGTHGPPLRVRSRRAAARNRAGVRVERGRALTPTGFEPVFPP